MDAKLPRTLFLSRGNQAVAWYRCALPAIALGCDWVCYGGEPPNLSLAWGKSEGDLVFSDLERYDVVIVQQPDGLGWAKAIRDLQAKGIVVLADYDDDMHSVRKKRDHDFSAKFSKKRLAEFELGMRAVDGMICSTPWLAQRYARFGPQTFVARNGIDLKRYALTLPARDDVAVGWSGGTGHLEAAMPWLREVAALMRERQDLRFVSVGQRFGDVFTGEFGAGRALSVPFTAIDIYPSAMANYDIALAPAGESNFYRAKSDLRWLEASALGQATIAHPGVYPEVEHGVTGFHASTPGEMRELLELLADDRELRQRVGAAAKAYVTEHRSAQVAARQWAEILQAVVPAVAAAA
jgi:glycosyltransferase involved in cell wall biosynthesis